ncbi:MAG: two-component regulator propeller domain-containing protein [Chloroflexota bacterium]|nr:two-component regulator propeller domain-containing protein [Chloroflexota bacterium]
MKKLLPLLMLLLLASPLSVQAEGGYSPWRTFTINDGLAANEVWAILQSEDGALWFGTAGGVSRYDGHWQTFTTDDGLADNHVTSIFQDREGAFWFGTTAGVSHYDGHWQTFTRDNGLVANEVWAILQSEDGALWFGTTAGVSHYDGENWQTFTTDDGLAADHVTSILQDKDGVLWFGTTAGVSRYDGENWQTFTTDDGLAADGVTSILQDRDEALWFGTTAGVSRYDGRHWQAFTTDDGLAANEVWAMLQDEEGTLWFGTDGGGINCYDGEEWQTFTAADGLAANYVTSILQDSDRTLWFGTVGGLSRYDRENWQIFTTADGLVNNHVTSILQDREGALWFGTWGGGISRYDGSSWQTFPAAVSPAANYITSIFQDRDEVLWFGTAGGVSRYDGHWQTFTTDDGLADNYVTSILQGEDGVLWFSTPAGVSRYDGENWQIFTTDDGLADNHATSILQGEDGVLWFGTVGGVSRYDGENWQIFTTDDGLAADHVISILQDRDGALWFGTWVGGASRYDGESWQTFTTADGLAANGIRVIFQDSDGVFWFGTVGGVSRYDGEGWQTLTAADGLAANVITSIVEDKRGIFWFGSSEGVSRHVPDKTPPWIRITAINDRHQLEEKISLPYDETSVIITFAGGDLRTEPKGLLYLCKLQGMDKDWVIGRENFKLYHDLSPGTYTFLVRARDGDFNYSDPAAVEIVIQPPAPTVNIPVLGSVSLPLFYTLLGTISVPLLALASFSIYRAQVRPRRALRRKFNPYISGEPIREEAMFFGREGVLAEVMNTLHNNHFAIYGDRRIGKTSILYQLANRLRKLTDPDYLFISVLINLQGISEQKLFYALMKNIAKECQSYVGELNLILATKQEGYDRFDCEDDLEMVLEALKGTADKEIKVVLLLDEGEIINKYDQLIQERLRSIFMTPMGQHLRMVWSGSNIDRNWKRKTSPWYNLFSREIHLLPFASEDALDLIKTPVKGIYRYEDEAVEQIITYSEGHPFEIQRLCGRAVNKMLEEKRTRVTSEDVKQAFNEILRERAEGMKPPFLLQKELKEDDS